MSEKVAGALALFGFLLVFGAVGGMDNPDQAEYFLEQLSLAIVGLGLMFVGVLRLRQE
jgi:cell division protein FtsW (lipid II flippase)